MATNAITNKTYGLTPVNIWAGEPVAERGVTLDTSFIQPDADGHQIVDPGVVLIPLPTGDFGRVYPYTLATTAISASSPTVVAGQVKYFKVGDVVVTARPYASLTYALTWANADTATILFDGVSIVHTVSGFTTLTALATATAATLNGNVAFAARATAIADAQLVHIFAKDNRTYSLVISGDGSAGNGTITANAAALQPNVVVGTITTSGINVATNTLTLAANAAVALPVGSPIAIAVASSNVLGVAGYQYILGSTQTQIQPDSNDIPAYNTGRVYRARLPFCDAWLLSALPQLTPIPR
jgi:hypothetical protein